MKKQKKRHTEQFKKDAVRLLENRGTQTAAQIAEKVGVAESMLYRWRQQYGDEVSSGGAWTQDERNEMEALRRRLREVEMENAILKKATALFAKDVK